MVSCIICGSKDCISVGQDCFINHCWEHLEEWKEKRKEYHKRWREKHPDYHAEKMRRKRKRERRQFSASYDGDLGPYKVTHISLESQVMLMNTIDSCSECGNHLCYDYAHGEYYCSSCGLVFELSELSRLYSIR